MKKDYEKIYDWEEVLDLFNNFLPELVKMQNNVGSQDIIKNFKSGEGLNLLDFTEEGKSSEEVSRYLIDSVYPYRMRTNHPRYFCFIPNDISPYSVFGEFLNSIHNPYGGGFSMSEGTANIENQMIGWMGEQVGYNKDRLGGQFVSGGSMANLTASIVARDDKLRPEEYSRATVYVSDQTHSSVAKGVHITGIDVRNIRKIKSDSSFRIDTKQLVEQIKLDIEDGYKPYLLVGSCGTTNTGSIDDLEELGRIAKAYNLWYHIDGAYGATALLSSYKDLMKGIESSDSISWDGHKWLFQTYGCAAIICRDKHKLIESFHVNPEYLKDVESQDEDINFWDMGIELTRPARGMKLWFTLQTVGLKAMRQAIDRGFEITDYIEEKVREKDYLEIVSPSQMGIINFRYVNDSYSDEDLDKINNEISKRAMERNYAGFLTTILNDRVVLRFCSNNPLTKKEEIDRIMEEIDRDIEEIIAN